MAGIYVHIPFCQSRCIYCGFYSSTHVELRQRYIDAVCREWQLRRQEQTEPSTIYIGGGTPSQLTAEQLFQLFDTLPSATDEVTLEVNPDDVTIEFIKALSPLPVTRISMGAQTFDDRRLRFLHRRHTAGQVSQAIGMLRNAGYHNISVDLMYGFPNEALDDWQHDIDKALALNVEHLSAYCLMVEENTALFELMNKEQIKAIDEELERQMYYTLIDRLTAAGYEHYEISNFAKKTAPWEKSCRGLHNSSYWHDIPYVGLGAAAHSYDGKRRSWNVADINEYILCIESGKLPSTHETLDADTHYNDRIATALRTIDGLDLKTLTDRQRCHCLTEAQCFLSNGLLKLTDDSHLQLTRKGLFVSDMVMSGLMLV